MRHLFHWFLISAVLLGASHVFPGITVESVKVAVIVAFILGLAKRLFVPRSSGSPAP